MTRISSIRCEKLPFHVEIEVLALDESFFFQVKAG